MYKFEKYNYALFGNPIDHSQSPQIHHLFAKQTGVFHVYQAINVSIDNFSSFVLNSFERNIKGANITSPFKKEAYFISNQLTERAKIAQSVNTLKKINNHCILGDNTDGIGLLSDLLRLKFIQKNYSVLIIGAGGAAKGVICSILSLGCSVYILNRTELNAYNLVKRFNKYGKIYIFSNDVLKNQYFDLIINATSRNVIKEDFIPLSMIHPNTCFYDMNYGSIDSSFIHWSKKSGGRFISNGIGMLVFQAAHSFLEWHNIFPRTDYIIDFLSKNN